MQNLNQLIKYHTIHFLFLILIILNSTVCAADITVSADRNPAVLNEQFTLTFSANDNLSGEPDFSPLQKDFDIVNQRKSSGIRIINGNVSQNTSWSLTLFPKRTGKLVIPEIHFGSDKSPAVTIDVSAIPVNSQNGQTSQDIIVEAEIKPKTVYVQQQLIYIQRLLYARDFFDNATLSSPQLKTGKIDIEKLGDQREYTEMRDGRQYKVIERRYAIFPIQSGKIEIAPTFFEGRLIEKGGQNRSFGFFSMPSGRLLRRYSPAISVNVKPKDSTFTGKNWLPSSNLTLHANWSIPPEQAKTGEPITLTIGMIANGLRAEQLPQLELTLPDNLKVYNDKAVLHNEANSDEIIGTRQEKFVIIAPQAGTYQIPEIKLAWWDINTNTQKFATIPATTLKATGAGAATAINPAPKATESKLKAQPLINKEPKSITPKPSEISQTNGTETETETKPQNNSSFWFYTAITFFLLSIILSYLLWQQYSATPKTVVNKKPRNKPLSYAGSLQKIKHACETQDGKQLRNALNVWGSSYLGLRNANLQKIMDTVKDADLQNEIQLLMKALYSPEKSQWNAGKLCKLVLNYQHPRKKEATTSRISSLYPDA